METNYGGQSHHFYGLDPTKLRSMGKRVVEWDLNDWKWDGDLFIATPVNALSLDDCRSRQFFPLGSGIPENGGSSNSSSTCSDEGNLSNENGKRGLEKRRRNFEDEDENGSVEVRGLNLKLGGGAHVMNEHDASIWEGNRAKKTKMVESNSNRAVCQVDHCGVDLRNAKDYHRRHKVCEMHSKAGKVLVGSVMQRFCQQCSRFQALQEFDEGKRSCRRRLAGHNKRRRKTNPDTVANEISSNGDQANGYLLITLLKMLSNMHSNSDEINNQDLLSHLLRSLAGNAGALEGRNISGLLQDSQDLLNNRTSNGNSGMVSALLSSSLQGLSRNGKQCLTVSASEMLPKGSLSANGSPQPSILYPIKNSPPTSSDTRDDSSGKIKVNNFDLNDIYIDCEDGTEDLERSPVPANLGIGSPECPSWLQHHSHQSSPPQTSQNSDSASAQSPSSSSGEAQSRTDRIVIKLFGKEPNDFPILLRAQILDWLSHSPTDIESYIRPGCIVLTIYLRLAESAWEEIRFDLSSSLNKLLDVSKGSFWTSGWVYVRVQQQIAFIYNGQVVLDTSLCLGSYGCSNILSIKPLAVPISEIAHFSVKGFKLSAPFTRLLCALDGKYLLQENADGSEEIVSNLNEDDELQSINFSCSVPAVTGRGFFEVEDCGLTRSFFPFIVAEKDICSEICMLETEIELSETDDTDARSEALDFVHEMGWLLHRSQLKTRLNHLDPSAHFFSSERFNRLTEFAMDRDWCAVVKKLLDILLVGGVGLGKHPSLKVALSDMGLLHRAVRRNSRPLVELLLRYVPEEVSDDVLTGLNEDRRHQRLFMPNAVGPAGLTPLHIAAGTDGTENVLDALTNDPEMVGIKAWKSARDSTGSTPEDYARLRGHYSYIHLVQRKAYKRSVAEQVVLDIPLPEETLDPKANELNSTLHIETVRSQSMQRSCKTCEQRLVHRNFGRSIVYRPAMLSMVAIAAVCVCVALLFKSSPEVLYVFQPFRWESLEYGSS